MIFPEIRLSERAEIDVDSNNPVVRFPTEEFIREREVATLTGFECSKGGRGYCFKFIFSNGMKTEGNNDGLTTHMMP
jgi:hypothetical protein